MNERVAPGYYWHLWCPDHGIFWGDTKHDACETCGYVTFPEGEADEPRNAIRG